MNRYLTIKLCLISYIFALILIGISTFPLEIELAWLNTCCGIDSSLQGFLPALSTWISEVYQGVKNTNAHYPFMAYGTDWLGFSHIILGLLFIGPLKNPIKNIWVVEFGMIACILVIPFALIFGHIREIPIFSRLIDCSFGVFGIIPLYIVWRNIKQLENESNITSA